MHRPDFHHGDPPNAFYTSVDGVLFNQNQTTLLEYPEGKVGEYTIPDGVNGIETRAFDSCTSLTGVTVPDSVTMLGDAVFQSCTNLTRVTLPNGLTNVPNYAFFSVPA